MSPVEHAHSHASPSASTSQLSSNTSSSLLSQLLGWAYEAVNLPVFIILLNKTDKECQLVYQNEAARGVMVDCRVHSLQLPGCQDNISLDSDDKWYSMLLEPMLSHTDVSEAKARLALSQGLALSQAATRMPIWMNVSIKSMNSTHLPPSIQLEPNSSLFVMTWTKIEGLMDDEKSPPLRVQSADEIEPPSTPSAYSESTLGSVLKTCSLSVSPRLEIQHPTPIIVPGQMATLAEKTPSCAPSLFSPDIHSITGRSFPHIDTHRARSLGGQSLPAGYMHLSPRSPFPFQSCSSRYETEFEEVQCLGKGGFGTVYRARNRLDGQEYAIKKVKLRCQASDVTLDTSVSPSPLSGPSALRRFDERIIREVKTFAQISTHSNVVRYYNAWIEPLRHIQPPPTHLLGKVDSGSSYSSSCSVTDSPHLYTQSTTHDHLHFDMDGIELDASGESVEDSEDADTGNTDKSRHRVPQRYPLMESPRERSKSPFKKQSVSQSSKRKMSTSGSFTASPYSSVLYIQMQLCPLTDLRKWMDLRKGQIDAISNMEVLTQILLGLHHVHSQGIIHRDLKPENIFVDENRVLLGDFGLAKNMGEHITSVASPVGSLSDLSQTAYVNTSTRQGTYLYTAPEILSSNMCTTKSDIYSFGVIMVELFSSFSTGMERAIVLKSIKDACLDKVKESLGEEYAEVFQVIESCLESDPLKRPSAMELLESEFFNVLRHSQGHTSASSIDRTSLSLGAMASAASPFGIEYRRRASIATEMMHWNFNPEGRKETMASPYREHRGSSSSYSRRSSRQDAISRRSSNSSALQHSFPSASNSTPIDPVYLDSEKGSTSTVETIQDQPVKEDVKLLQQEMEKLKLELQQAKEREGKLKKELEAVQDKAVVQGDTSASEAVPPPPPSTHISHPLLLQRTLSTTSSASSTPPSFSVNNSMARLFLTPSLMTHDKLDFRKQPPKPLTSPPAMSPSMSSSSSSSRRLSALSLSFEQFSKKEAVTTSPKASAPTLSPNISACSTTCTSHATANGTMIVTENVVNVLAVSSVARTSSCMKPIIIPKK